MEELKWQGCFCKGDETGKIGAKEDITNYMRSERLGTFFRTISDHPIGLSVSAIKASRSSYALNPAPDILSYAKAS